jgi:hypothetical protein
MNFFMKCNENLLNRMNAVSTLRFLVQCTLLHCTNIFCQNLPYGGGCKFFLNSEYVENRERRAESITRIKVGV